MTNYPNSFAGRIIKVNILLVGNTSRCLQC